MYRNYSRRRRSTYTNFDRNIDDFNLFTRRRARVFREYIRAPTPPPVIRREITRLRTPSPEIIERTVYRRYEPSYTESSYFYVHEPQPTPIEYVPIAINLIY